MLVFITFRSHLTRSTLSKDVLHKADENRITFAKRGKSDRIKELGEAIAKAKLNFEKTWRKGCDKPTSVFASEPSKSPALQVVDYYLWAVQRAYERSEFRFYNSVASAYRTILDIDDDRKAGYGAYYTARNPLTEQKVKPCN